MPIIGNINTDFFSGSGSLAERLAQVSQEFLDDTGTGIQLNLDKLNEKSATADNELPDNPIDNKGGFVI
jgi:hypothetical protein